MPTVSVPTPMIGASSASHLAHSTEKPGVCDPESSTLRNSASSLERASQPVRNSIQPPCGNAPCSLSHSLMWSTSRTKSASASACSLKSSTAAGATRRVAGTCETSSWSLPVTQWIGASKCVPVCSPVWMLFQYQAGPRSS